MAKPLPYVLQFLLWVFLYFLPYLFSFRGKPNIQTIFSDSGDVVHLISFIFLIAYTYVHYFLILPRLYFKRRYVFYILSLLACFYVVIKSPQFFEFLSRAGHRPGPAGEPHPILFGMTYNIILFLGATFTGISLHYRNRLFVIEKEKLTAEISFLKAQINPHFLFNTLNSIYFLAIEKSDDTPKAIIQLSELMRYIIRDSNADKVELNKELAYIGNYIALQKNRLGDTATIVFSMDAGHADLKIAPLLLMSFIENAFKYGVNPDCHSEIHISILTGGTEITLHLSNTIVSGGDLHDSDGIGIKNAQARLSYLYPGKFQLTVSNEEKIFTVHLTIDLS